MIDILTNERFSAMNADLQQIILLNIEETVKNLRASNRKASTGIVFAVDQISKQMNMAPQQVSEALENLVKLRKLHRVSRDHYSLGDNPWGGQRRSKIFRCQHCGRTNEVDITGD